MPSNAPEPSVTETVLTSQVVEATRKRPGSVEPRCRRWGYRPLCKFLAQPGYLAGHAKVRGSERRPCPAPRLQPAHSTQREWARMCYAIEDCLIHLGSPLAYPEDSGAALLPHGTHNLAGHRRPRVRAEIVRVAGVSYASYFGIVYVPTFIVPLGNGWARYVTV